MAGLRAYTYHLLQSAQDTIRLLTLHPGQFRNDISATLGEESYQTPVDTPYECLSYTWGEWKSQGSLEVWNKLSKDVDGPCPLQCRLNLWTALQYLRHPHQPRVIWADAICINQTDIAERSRQVACMGEIYKNAFQVVVWLGPEDQQTATALEVIERLSRGITLEDDHRGVRTIPGSEAEAVERQFPESMITPEHWISLNEFIRRPWFERLWVRQEVLLASKVVMKCGLFEVDWVKLEKVIIFLEQKVDRVYFEVQDILRCRSLFRYEGSESLTYALHRSSFCKCADERDRVYANLSTSSAMQALRIEPNYTSSVANIFKNMMVSYVQHFHDLDLLRMCDIDNVPPGFMTFVPNFARPGADSRLCSVYAHAGAKQSLVIGPDGAIQVKGRRVDVVQSVSKAKKPLVKDGPTGSNHLQIVETYHQWEQDHLVPGSTYPGGGNALDAFVTLLSNGFCRETYNLSNLPTIQESIDAFLAAFSRNGDSDQIYHPRYKGYLWTITSDRRPEIFFRTVQGYIGTSPSQVQDGDTVAVLLGASVPIVLRPVKERQGVHQVVGPCYLQGVMFGEALLGPLPDRWTCVQGSSVRQWCFKLQGSDKLSKEDPRLWSIGSHWVTHFCEFVEDSSCTERCDVVPADATGSADRWFYDTRTKTRSKTDPRLNVQGLEAGGVILDEFTLV